MLCTSGVIYGEKAHVHHAYMGKRIQQSTDLGLRWRKTRIADWRTAAGFTQQQVADALTEHGIKLDRVSVGRIEGGKQMPTIEALEFMATMFKTDITSMLNLTPEQAKHIREFGSLDTDAQDTILRMVRAARGGG